MNLLQEDRQMYVHVTLRHVRVTIVATETTMRCVLLAYTSLTIYDTHNNAFMVNSCGKQQWNVPGCSYTLSRFFPRL
jgi:hypothetical protein